MPRTTLIQTQNPGNTGATRGLQTLDFDEVDPVTGVSLNQARAEVDDACADIETFVNREPDEIMRLAAGHSARLSTLRIRAMRIEDFKRQWKDVRTRELEPCIEELRKQWEHGSRLHTVREFDWRVESGER